MKWATRAGIHIDRAASAWLISRYIDTEAEFSYVSGIDDVESDTTAFDMRGGTFTHVGDDVTFETLLRHFELDDPILWAMAEIVHEADLADGRFDAPEADGLDLVIRSLSDALDDEEARRLSATIFDSMHGYLRRLAIERASVK